MNLRWTSVGLNKSVKSHFLAICTLQPLLSNCQFTSSWPLQAAPLRGILPSIPVISTLTPWSSNHQKKLTWPFIVAFREVSKHYFLHYTLATCFCNSRKTSMCPFVAAILRGVKPLLFARSTSAPCFNSSRTTST